MAIRHTMNKRDKTESKGTAVLTSEEGKPFFLESESRGKRNLKILLSSPSEAQGPIVYMGAAEHSDTPGKHRLLFNDYSAVTPEWKGEAWWWEARTRGSQVAE